MKRFFNTTGLCNPQDHYMVPPFRGMLEDVCRLIATKQWFFLHAPRQTGKTTFLHELAHRLNREGAYTACVVSLEEAGVESFTEAMANERMVDSLYSMRKQFLSPEEYPPEPRPSHHIRKSPLLPARLGAAYSSRGRAGGGARDSVVVDVGVKPVESE